MRDYIILNGVNSNTITGLLISKLPPITKPKQRTQIEEINGRDGDIVTTLGYSAYDKEIEIGLYGDFDIDDVMTFFNGEGTVTFSNEEDKYYNYQILDQIDYEKLIRFKTAKVKMHVQPFKYPLEETPVEITIQNVTGSGEAIDLDNTAEAPMTIALKGNTSQEGTPTPETPQDIHVVSGDNEINVCGKNLLPKIETTNTQMETGVDYYGVTYFISVLPNTQYTLSCGNDTRGYQLREFTSDKEVIKTTGVVFGNAYTTTSTTRYIKFRTNNVASSFTNTDFQFEKGSKTTYEPYQGKSYPISLGDIELCKIGDYQDRIYKDSGKWYIEKQIGKVVLDGSETISSYGATSLSGSYQATFEITTKATSTDKIVLSDFFTSALLSDRTTKTNIIYTYTDGLLRIATNLTTTMADFKIWLSTHNTIVYYVLATPTTTEITDETLIAQLNALAGAESYSGQTNISQTNDDKPFILNATALQRGSGEATVENEGNIYSKPTLDIEGSGTVGIYLDGNQMFSVDLSNASECIIDTASLEAYNPSTDALMNRQVTGDYSNFKLNAGDNQVKATGDITKVTISNYTRYL